MKNERAICDIAAEPRTPLPFERMVIRPGETVVLVACPQIHLHGPYWLGVSDALTLDVLGIRFGQNETLASQGGVPAEFFAFDPSEPLPRHMVPIEGRTLCPGLQVALTVRNPTPFTQTVCAVLWGTRVKEFQTFTVPHEREAWRARRADREATRKALEPFEPGDAWESPTDES